MKNNMSIKYNDKIYDFASDVIEDLKEMAGLVPEPGGGDDWIGDNVAWQKFRKLEEKFYKDTPVGLIMDI